MFFKQRVPEEAVAQILKLAQVDDEPRPEGFLVPAIFGSKLPAQLPMIPMAESIRFRKAGVRVGAAILEGFDVVLVSPEALRAALQSNGVEKLRRWKDVERALEREGYEVVVLEY
jgi:hypothetical protein